MLSLVEWDSLHIEYRQHGECNSRFPLAVAMTTELDPLYQSLGVEPGGGLHHLDPGPGLLVMLGRCVHL